VSAAVGETNNAATDVHVSADNLGRQSGDLRAQIDGFLERMRSL
jgi:methyl-accepting chemotaxis protein